MNMITIYSTHTHTHTHTYIQKYIYICVQRTEERGPIGAETDASSPEAGVERIIVREPCPLAGPLPAVEEGLEVLRSRRDEP
jgi:hypothetical protein